MAVKDIKENVRLKLELDGGLVGDKQVVKSKTFSRVKPVVENEDLYNLAQSLGELQTLPLVHVKRLEEILLIEE